MYYINIRCYISNDFFYKDYNLHSVTVSNIFLYSPKSRLCWGIKSLQIRAASLSSSLGYAKSNCFQQYHVVKGPVFSNSSGPLSRWFIYFSVVGLNKLSESRYGKNVSGPLLNLSVETINSLIHKTKIKPSGILPRFTTFLKLQLKLSGPNYSGFYLL